MTISNAMLHYYRQARRHQIETYGPSRLHANGADLRQHHGGGAAYGWHAVAAYNYARGQIHFRERYSK